MPSLREAATQALEALEGGADSWQLVGPAIDALKAALAEPAQEPVAWIDDSGHPKHLSHLQSATERRLYGPLRPLYTTPPPAEPVQEQPVCDECGKHKQDGWALYCVGCVEPLFTSKTEPVEPVAWMNTEDGFCTLDSPVEGIDVMSQWVPLYGSPPQRQAEPVQEPVAWNWMLDGQPYGQAYYGNPPDADIVERAAISGRTVRLLYTDPPQRKPLTDEEIDKLPWGPHEGNPVTFAEGLRDFARAIERAHGIT